MVILQRLFARIRATALTKLEKTSRHETHMTLRATGLS